MMERTPSHAWRCLDTRTRTDWLDANGHVNVRYYFRMTAHAAYELMDRILMGGERSYPLPMYVTLEARMTYRVELMPDQDVRVDIRPLRRSEKTLTVLMQIWRMTPRPALAAECEWIGAYMNPETRRIEPLSRLTKSVFDQKLAEGDGKSYTRPRYPRGDPLPAPPEANRIISFEGKISEDWIDRMGHMGIEHYQLIFSRANRGYLEALGYGIETLRERGLTLFTLGSVTRYLHEIKLGEPLIVKTRMLSLQSKTETHFHELWRAGAEPIPCATFENTAAFVDRRTRRSVAVPVDFGQKIQSIHGISAVPKKSDFF